MVYYDSQSEMDIKKNTMYHSHTNDIDVRYHWSKEAVEGKY